MSDQTTTSGAGPGADHIPAQPTAPSVESTTGASTPPAPQVRETRSAFRRNLLPLGAGFAVGLLVMGVLWASTAGVFGTGSFTLHGQMTLMPSSGYGSYSSSAYYLGQDGSCSGEGGYSDIGAGTAVNVYDQSGAVVAIGRLSAGNGSYSSGCTFSFAVPDVPSGSKFYQVEVSHRGKMNLSAADAEAGAAAYTLGGN